MAATKKSNARKTTTKKKAAASESGLKDDIILLIMLAVSLLLMISNFGVGGKAGEAFSRVFFGLFGFLAYIVPVILFFGTAFCMANKGNALLLRKIIGAVCCVIFFCAFLHLLMIGYVQGDKILDCYGISAEQKLGGGILGGAVAVVLGSAFEIIGAYVIIVIALIIAAIVMTQKPLVRTFAHSSSKVYRSAKDESQKRKSELKQKRQERREEKLLLEETDKDAFFTDTELPKAPAQKKSNKKNTIKKAAKEKVQDTIPEPEISVYQSAHDSMELIQPEDSPVDVDSDIEDTSSEETADVKREKRKNPKSSQKEMQEGISHIQKEIRSAEDMARASYKFPPLSLLRPGSKGGGDSKKHLQETARKLQDTLHNFGVDVTVLNASCGPTVTRYELQPEQGVKVSRITNLTDDIKLNLAASDIRIEAPIPGKAAVGIEVPNEHNTSVHLRDLLQTEEFKNSKSNLSFAAGKDIGGKTVIADIAKMPHLLIAGATGSGKSVCINTLIVSILYKANPADVKLIMIDPKVVELSVYNGIPHLMIPVVTEPKKAAGALNWAVAEMNERYNKFAEYGVRDLVSYNQKVDGIADIEEEGKPEKMPQIVIIVDELADLMMVAPGEVEDAICRLAQLARAAGIHLIIATQRPSVNVITGLIKANMPSRVAFSVTSGVDSRTILDMNGAEKLLGKGDMLFYPQGYPKPVRVQGAFVSDDEVAAIVEFLTKNTEPQTYSQEIQDKINASTSAGAAGTPDSDIDAYFVDAGKFIIEKDKASIGMLQRVFKIGFNRAARIMDQLSEAGVVGPEEGTKPRKVLMSPEEFENYIEESL